MSIQSNINQGIAIAGALYTQTPNYAAKKEAKLEEQEIEHIDKSLNNLVEKTDSLINKKNIENNKLAKRTLNPITNINKKLLDNEVNKIVDEISNDALYLLKRRGELTGNYNDYMDLKFWSVNKDAKRALKAAQEEKRAKERKKLLNLPVSFGGSIKDLPEAMQNKIIAKLEDKNNGK